MKKKKLFTTKKIVLSGLVIAIYTVIMYFTQSFSFGQYQIRIATSLYSLSAIDPILIIPLGLANLISNSIMGGMGIYDIVGGCLVGIITSSVVYIMKRLKMNDIFIAIPIILGPGLLVPIWLSPTLHISYKILAASLCIGQIIPAIVGVLLLKQLKNTTVFK
ncbi:MULTISPECIES: QueT transporter family protein [Clostridium]|uniref:QueT transporter family protein n=1 Tax=Clostridium TaxID=1485 RepID=UPI000826067A|nr:MULTISPECIES: QueT transporter family protein [Clostridium]PJI07416.1 QueT transporter family protein [Clostridium sp. CT7]